MNILIVSIFSVLGFWFGRYIVLRIDKWIDRSIQEGDQREDERRREGVKRGVAEYLEAKKRWKKEGDENVS